MKIKKLVTMFTRLATSNALRFSVSRPATKTIQFSSITACRQLSTTKTFSSDKISMTAQEELDKWNANNKKFNRPLSPHLQIYEWSVPMTISACYRVFAFMLGFGFLLLPVAFTFSSTLEIDPTLGKSIIDYSESMRNAGGLSTATLLALKASFVGPFVFHCVNGCRHLGWDKYAYGIRHLSQVYSSGYIVIGITCVLTAMIVCGLNSTK